VVGYYRRNMNTESLSKRRGRPAGSNSFARIRMVDLLKMVGENAVVPVSKVWLRNNGIEAVDIKVATVPQAI